jgi:hypothetical protein
MYHEKCKLFIHCLSYEKKKAVSLCHYNAVVLYLHLKVCVEVGCNCSILFLFDLLPKMMIAIIIII